MKPTDQTDLINVEAMRITTPEELRIINERLDEARKTKQRLAEAWLKKQSK